MKVERHSESYARRFRGRIVASIAGAALLAALVGPVPAVADPGLSPFAASTAASAPSAKDAGWLARSFPIAPDLVGVAGLAYDSVSGAFVVTGRTADGDRGFRSVSLSEHPGESVQIRSPFGPVAGLGYDAANDVVTVAEAGSGDLFLASGSNLRRGTAFGLSPHPIGSLLGADLAGITTDPASGDLFGLVSGTAEVLQFSGDDPARRRGTAARSIKLTDAPTTLSSIAFNAADGLLYLAGPEGRLLVYDTDGNPVVEKPLTDGIAVSPSAMVFAPSGDATDDPSTQSLYLLDGSAAAAGGAQIIEISFTAAASTAAVTVAASLENRIDTSAWAPPSPDPAGITFDPTSSRLLIADSEVDETPIYAGVNLWKTSTTGVVTGTANTIAYTDEPTGLSYNSAPGFPSTGHLFVSSDDAQRIFEVAPGTDGILHTPDDIVTSFDTEGFGSTDPEGVEFDPTTGNLFIIDGLNKEVFRIDPGSDGMFDGVGDEVTHFDVQSMGVLDPEGIGIDVARGVLLIADRPSESVVEVTPNGLHIRTIDLSSVNPFHLASVTIAPGSASPLNTNLYVTTRGVNNLVDPNENDGEILEFSVPANSVNVPPSLSAGIDQSVIQPAAASLNATVTDDGLPNPPAAVTTMWTKVSGPGTAAFANASSVDTTATFSAPGTYVLQLEANDSAASTVDRVTITAQDPAGPFTVLAGIGTGSDDAEELISNKQMFVDSPDHDLTFDPPSQHFIVGLRYAVDVPPGATITDARIQFRTDETTSAPANLVIQAQAADAAATFAWSAGNISSRPRTVASVAWAPPAWNTLLEAGPGQRTSNFASVIQEVVERPGWGRGNTIAIIISGTGDRVADSFEGGYGPILTVEYTLPTALPAGTTVGLVDPGAGLWHLRNSASVLSSFYYGNPGDYPFVGDWNCNSDDTPGLYRRSDGYVYLRNSNTQGIADIKFFFGNPGDLPLAGDFNGDGCDSVSIYRPSEARFYIINELGSNDGGLGAADYSFLFGDPGDKPVVGDWDGDGIDEIGLHRESTGFFYYRNTLTTGIADGQFYFGDPGDRFIAGDWGIVDGRDTPGLYRPSDGVFYFRHTLTQGNADSLYPWAGAGSSWLPIAGDFGLD